MFSQRGSPGRTHADRPLTYRDADRLPHARRQELAEAPDRPQTSQSATTGPTASNNALPTSPAANGSATFNANVTTLAPTSNRRADRIVAPEAPHADNHRTATSNATTVTSTAGATNGATQTGTPRRRASTDTFPKPNRNVSPTTTPTMMVTAETTGSRRVPGRVTATTRARVAIPRLDRAAPSDIREPEASPRPPPHDNSSRHTTTPQAPCDQTKRSCPTSLDTTRQVKPWTLNQRVRDQVERPTRRRSGTARFSILRGATHHPPHTTLRGHRQRRTLPLRSGPPAFGRTRRDGPQSATDAALAARSYGSRPHGPAPHPMVADPMPSPAHSAATSAAQPSTHHPPEPQPALTPRPPRFHPPAGPTRCPAPSRPASAGADAGHG